MLTCNNLALVASPPVYIVPALADRGVYFSLKRSTCHVLHPHGQSSHIAVAVSGCLMKPVRCHSSGRRFWKLLTIHNIVGRSRYQT